MEYCLSAALLLHVTFLGTHKYKWMAELQDLVKFFHAENFIHEYLQDTNIIYGNE